MNLLAIGVLILGLALITVGVVLILRDTDLPDRGIAYRTYAALLVLAGTGVALLPILFAAGVE